MAVTLKSLRFCKYLCQLPAQQIRCNCHKASITRVNRGLYARLYPTLLVQPDGSTITIRYKEPRKMIALPLDINTVSEIVKQQRISNRKPKKKIVIEEEIEDSYDSSQYADLWKK